MKHNIQVLSSSKRLTEMLQRQQKQPLSADERSDLDRYLRLEHLLTVAQLRAQKIKPYHPPKRLAVK